MYLHSEHLGTKYLWDEVAEWLRRWTANPMCSARVGSNPILVDFFFIFAYYKTQKHNNYIIITFIIAL
jgi:hypothetical protein